MRAAPAMDLSRLRERLLAIPVALRRRICAAHLALIAVLSLLPAWVFPAGGPGVPGMDKIAHVAMYGVLGALMRWAAGPGGRSFIGRWGPPLAGAGYGLLLETLQPWIGGGGRMFSWGDAAANLAGVALFWGVSGWFLGRGKNRLSG